MTNYQDYFYNLRELNALEEKELFPWFFENIFGYKEKEEEIWQSFYPLYKQLNPEARYRSRRSYGYCFSALAWRLFNRLSREEIYTLVDSSSFLLFLQGKDLWEKIVNYVDIKGTDEEYVVDFYSNLKNRFLHSKEIISIDNGIVLTMNNLLEKTNSLITREDSLALAEFFLEVEQKIKIRLNEIDNQELTPKDVLLSIKSLLEFFMGTDENSIYSLLYGINNPNELIFAAEKLIQPSSSTIEENPVEEVEETSSQFKEVDYKSIKISIENAYNKDENGDFVDLPGVLNKIMELANKYNDPKIKELYYFDENKNKFVWNEGLL